MERINFTADQVGNLDLPGVRTMVDRLASEGETISPERLVDRCLEMLGGYQMGEETQAKMLAHAQKQGELRTTTEEFSRGVAQLLQLIVATPEYLYA